MNVEVLVSYRVVVNVRNARTPAGALMIAEPSVKSRLPRGAYDVLVVALVKRRVTRG